MQNFDHNTECLFIISIDIFRADVFTATLNVKNLLQISKLGGKKYTLQLCVVLESCGFSVCFESLFHSKY